MNMWKKTTLGEVCSKIGSGATPRGGSDSYKDEGISLIRSQNVLDLDFTYSGLALIDQEQADDLANVEVQKEDVLINITGDSVARVCMVPDKVLPARVNQHVSILRANSVDLNPYYLKYYLINRSIKQTLLIMANSGATRNALTKGQLEGFPILLPSPPEQKAIAAVLSSFDDKIELLRRQNKTLESIAQAIFKEWFVNFTVDGKKLKIDSKTGLPVGWRMGKLAEIANISIGRTPPRKESDWFSFNPKDRKWISIKDMGNADIYIGNTSEYLTEKAVERFNIPIIPDNTVIVSFKLTVGRVAITTEQMLSNEAIAHIKVHQENLLPEYIYLSLNIYNFDLLGSTSSIATAVNSQSIKQIEITVPDETTSEIFNRLIEPVFKKIKNNFHQIQTLSKLRDLLLPKLMKGEIRVKM